MSHSEREQNLKQFSERCTITTTWPNFSAYVAEPSNPGLSDGLCKGHELLSYQYKKYFVAMFFADGSRVEEKGHVSILFQLTAVEAELSEAKSFSCTASVIDASGGRRFSKSLALDSEVDLLTTFKAFGFDRFVERSTLLAEPSRYLPGDTLTLRLEVELAFALPRRLLNSTSDVGGSNKVCFLRMDSDFVQHLCNMSRVISRMVEASKNKSEELLIRYHEHKFFIILYKILCCKSFDAELDTLYNITVLNNKYGMREAADMCSQLVESIVRADGTEEILKCIKEEVEEILFLPEEYDVSVSGESLKCSLSLHADIKNKIRRCGEFDATKARELEWSCQHKGGCWFKFKRIEREISQMENLTAALQI